MIASPVPTENKTTVAVGSTCCLPSERWAPFYPRLVSQANARERDGPCPEHQYRAWRRGGLCAMQRLRDRQWQAPYLAAYGVAHVPWSPVLQSYVELSQAADILGRPDLAAALDERVTPALAHKYAPALAVLRSVARNPLEQPLPTFAPEPVEPTRQEIWAEAMHDIRAELQLAEFSASDDETDVMLSEADVETSSESCHSEPSLKAARILGPDRAAKPTPLSPFNLSHANFVRELALSLFGLQSLQHGSVRGLTDACYASVWTRFDYFAKTLRSLPHGEMLKARSEILQWNCYSVVQLVARAEQLLAKYTRQQEPVDTASVRMWLEGDGKSPAVTLRGTEFMLAPDLLPELRHPLLLRAGECGLLAERIHRTQVPPVPLEYTSPQQYAADIYRAYMRNSELLMTAALKSRLSDAWQDLAGVYLAQDSRMLLLLDELVQSPSHSHVQHRLREIWPTAPFHLSEQLVPEYTSELDVSLELILGPKMETLFPKKRLVDAWHMIVGAFRSGDQLVEITMAEWAASVSERISSAHTLEPLL